MDDIIDDRSPDLKSILRWRKDDKYIILAMTAPTIIIWIYLVIKKHFSISLLGYGDSIYYTYIAKTMYEIPKDNVFTNTSMNLNRTDFSAFYPMSPLLLKTLSFFTFGNYQIAGAIFALFFSAFSGYLFRRVLCVYQLTKHDLQASILYSIIPIRSIAIRSSFYPDSLENCLIYLALLGIASENQKVIFWSIFFGVLNHPHMFTLVMALFFNCFIAEEYGAAFSYLKGWIFGSLIAQIWQWISIDTFSSYYTSLFNLNILCSFPGQMLLVGCSSIMYMEQFHTSYMYSLLCLIGYLFMPKKNKTFEMFLIMESIYVLWIGQRDFGRNAAFAESIMIIAGFDCFINSQSVQKIINVFIGIYGALGLITQAISLQNAVIQENIFAEIMKM